MRRDPDRPPGERTGGFEGRWRPVDTSDPAEAAEAAASMAGQRDGMAVRARDRADDRTRTGGVGTVGTGRDGIRGM
jgi:hypothetical protein